MQTVPVLLNAISKILNREKISFMVIGGQAMLVYGEPRMTKDLGITLGIINKGKQSPHGYSQRENNTG